MFARGGYNWILGALLLSALFLLSYIYYQHSFLLVISMILMVLDCFFFVFFRDPERQIGKGIVSPADGVVMAITYNKPRNNGSDDSMDTVRIATFMNITNVHVNRAPLDGVVVSMVHRHGGFLPAYRPESKQNERLITTIRSPIGYIKIIQIAGIVAKRIVPYIKPGMRLKKGERIGIIQFGSRVDVILPKDKVTILVEEGLHVKAAIDSIAKIVDT